MNKNECVNHKRSTINVTHGESRTRLYAVWASTRSSYSINKYGTVYKGWDDYLVFKKWSIDNGWKDKSRLTRKDKNKGFSPENCYVYNAVDIKTINKKSVMIVYNNRSQSITDWAREIGVSRACLWSRLYVSKLPIAEALHYQKV